MICKFGGIQFTKSKLGRRSCKLSQNWSDGQTIQTNEVFNIIQLINNQDYLRICHHHPSFPRLSHLMFPEKVQYFTGKFILLQPNGQCSDTSLRNPLFLSDVCRTTREVIFSILRCWMLVN